MKHQSLSTYSLKVCKNEIVTGAKVVSKAYPDEKVGVFAVRDGSTEVVEYSELDPEEASATDPGALSYPPLSPPPHLTLKRKNYSASPFHPSLRPQKLPSAAIVPEHALIPQKLDSQEVSGAFQCIHPPLPPIAMHKVGVVQAFHTSLISEPKFLASIPLLLLCLSLLVSLSPCCAVKTG